MALRGNTRPEANSTNDRGRVPDDLNFPHLALQLQRTPEQEAELEQFINDLHDPASPLFHHWITASEFGQRFGVAPPDVTRVADWLQSEGFQINKIYPNQMVIDFAATAGQIRQALHTEIHSLQVKGQAHIANMSDPQIPAELASTVAGIYSLNDFRPRPENHPVANYTWDSGEYAVVPADLWTIYNFSPAFAAGYSGQGQTIVVVEDTDLYANPLSTSDWSAFRSTLGLSTLYPSATLTTIQPGGCTDPGVNGDDGEAAIDVEWASAAAPNAAIVNASCYEGPLYAIQELVNGGSPPSIISMSYGASESVIGSGGNAYIFSMYQQAVTEGVSLFVSSGDQGPASSDDGDSYALSGITVSGFTSTPYNVSVGGTDFADSYLGIDSTYWSSTNAANFGSAKSYIMEIPWNDSCAGALINSLKGYTSTFGTSSFCSTGSDLNIIGGSGGPSSCGTGSPDVPGLVGGTCAGYSKPSWQSGFLGNPIDGVRDIPDIALFASNGFWSHYYVTCYSDTNFGGRACSVNPSNWAGFGGTSVSSPIMAGVQALINQATGSQWGNPDSAYYAIAASEYGASGNSNCSSALGNGVASTCIFYDLNPIDFAHGGSGSGADNNVPCFGMNCYLPSGSVGVLSTAPQSLTSVAISDFGSGYTSAPTCALNGGGGSGGTCSASLTGVVNSISAVNLGSGYSSPPTCSLSGGGGGVGASCAVSLSQGAVNGIALLSNGSGYTSAPTCTISAPVSGTTATCETTEAFGVGVTLTAAGSGYTTLPACSLTGGGGTGAACFALAFNSSSGFQPAFELGTGWDFPSGIGSVNVANLVGAFTLGIPSFSSSSLNFSAQTLNTTSSAQSVTIKNISASNLLISTAALGGADPGEFNKTADTCTGATVTPNNTCIVSVTFTPTVSGTQTATLTFTDNATITTQTVTLSGSGAGAPEASTSGDLAFGNQFLQTTSGTMTETLTNVGTVNLVVSTATVGGTNPGDFSKNTDGCTGATLLPNGACTVKIVFTPSATGTRSATLTFNDNGQGPSGSSQMVNLGGTGTAPVASPSPSSLSFSNQFEGTTSGMKPVTLNNTGTDTLTISNIGTSANYGQTNNCNGSVTAGSFCTINVTFTPGSTGLLNGALTITDNSNAVAGSMQTVNLSGTGTAPVASPSPSSLSFNNQNLGTTSGMKSVTLNNTGTDTLTVSNVGTSGNFAQTNNCGSVTAGSFCTINVTFTPLAVGSLSGTLTITDNSNAVPGSMQMVGLSGTGVGPLVSLSATSLTYQPQPLGVAGTQTVTLTNPGNATLNISGITISGYFSQANTCGTAVIAGANCKITVTFNPRGVGANTGTLAISDNAGGSPHTVSLSGTGVVSTVGPQPPGVQPPPANPQPGH